MLEHFQVLLEGVVADPDRPVSRLPILGEAERRQLVVEWNDTARNYPHDRCMHHLFEAQVERAPDDVAVIVPAIGSVLRECLTYQELNQRANQLTHYLQKLGVGPETLVGICVERSLDMMVGLLGILKAGGAYVPLDPTYPPDRLAFMIEDSQVPVLVTQESLLSELPAHEARVVCLDVDWEVIARESKENPDIDTTPDNLAYVIYTSGSTGEPRGVLVQHGGVVNHNIEVIRRLRLGPDDRMLQFATINFDTAVEEIFPTWFSGGTLVLRPDVPLAISTDFTQLLEDEKLTIVDPPRKGPARPTRYLARGGRR